MQDPRGLYELVGDPAAAGSLLLHCLDGFLDAGNAGALAINHLMSTRPHREIARFDVDQLVDYRARRPVMTFQSDHFTEVAMPQLLVHELEDDSGSSFLLMSGPEPDTQWDRFTAAVGELMGDVQSRIAVSVHGIPWNSPHTRPLGMSAHASDRTLISGRPQWLNSFRVPGHVSALLELRLPESGFPTAGFSVHVPNYLSATDFPGAAAALLDAVAALGDLSLPTTELTTAATTTLAAVDAEVRENSEHMAAISELERAYDAASSGNSLPGNVFANPTVPEDEMPSGDDLAKAFEQYLRSEDSGSAG